MKLNKYRCKECGSENLIWRGYIVWDFESQKFEKVEVDYEAFCDDCNAEDEPVKRRGVDDG
jgi:Zn finger protein HypA/HybF involved in hydrogenase expression